MSWTTHHFSYGFPKLFHGKLTIFPRFPQVFPWTTDNFPIFSPQNSPQNAAKMAGVASVVPEPRLVRRRLGAAADAEPPRHRAGRGAGGAGGGRGGGGAGPVVTRLEPRKVGENGLGTRLEF